MTIIHADVLTWAATYDGPKFHAMLTDPLGDLSKLDAIDVVLPEDQELMPMLDSTIQLAPIVCDVAVLDGREVIDLIPAWIGMPERAMNFDQSMDGWKVKIIAVAAQPILLLIGNAHAVKDSGELLFKSIVCFARTTGSNLIGSQFSMALARSIGRELAEIGCADLLSGFWRMCAAVHAVLRSNIGLAPHRYFRGTQVITDRALGYLISLGYLRLRQPFSQVHLAQKFVGQHVGSVSKFLGIAIRPARNADTIHLLPNGWDGNTEHRRYFFQRFLFSPV